MDSRSGPSALLDLLYPLISFDCLNQLSLYSAARPLDIPAAYMLSLVSSALTIKASHIVELLLSLLSSVLNLSKEAHITSVEPAPSLRTAFCPHFLDA
jgi:hypothetical protein